MDVGMLEADAAELHHVLGLEPDREPAVIERLVAEIADAQAGHLDAVLVGIERAGCFAKGLAHAVVAVRPRRHIGADSMIARIEANRMVRRREHHALDALPARCLEQVVAADDVGRQDGVPGAFDRIAAEMQDAVDALADRLDLSEVGQVGCLELLVRCEGGRRLDIAEQEVRIDRRQQLAQRRAYAPRRAGHQNTWHLLPRLHLSSKATNLRSPSAIANLRLPICDLGRAMIADHLPRKRNNENRKCQMHLLMIWAGVLPLITPIPPSMRSIRALKNTGSSCRRSKGWPRACAVRRALAGSATGAILCAATSPTNASSSGRRKPARSASTASRPISPMVTPATARAGSSPANMADGAWCAPNMT